MVNNPNIRFAGFADDWAQCKLGELAKVQGGNAWSSSDYVENGQYLVITISNVTGNEYVTDSSGNYIDCINPGMYELSENDILVSLTGNVGRVSKMTKTRAVLNQRVARVSTGDGVDGAFIFHILSKSEFESQMVRVGQGAAQMNISNRDIVDYGIKMPTLKEQQKIGAIFSTLDHKIGLEERQIALLKDLKKGYLQKMFPKDGAKVPELRFAGFAGDWEERKLGELMDVTSVKRIHQSDWTNRGVQFLRARDIVSAAKREEPSDYLYISEERYAEYSKVSGKVQIGDLLVTGVGTIGVPMLVVHKDPLYFKDGNIIWFKNKSNIDGNFFYYSFIGVKIQKYIRDVAGIGTVGTYTIDSGKKTPIYLPQFEEQEKIGSFFKQLDDTIAANQHKLELLKDLKKGLLQQLFV